MKRVATLSLCTLALAATMAAACSKKAADAPTTATDAAKSEVSISTPGAGGLTPQQIADAVSKSVCKRLPGCNPSGGSEADCVAGLSKDIATNMGDELKAVTQTQLDGCVASIARATCDQLQNPPTGCEFIK